MKTALLLLAAGIVAASAASADVRDAVNHARLHGCPAPASSPLRNNMQLQQAAMAMAGGKTLDGALASAGYRQLRISALHLSGAEGDTEVGRLVSAHYCSTLTDGRFKDMGAYRRGDDVWLLIAAPVTLPSLNDAEFIDADVLKRVNAARAVPRHCGDKAYAAAAPLTLNQRLNDAALAHSRQMANTLQLDHRGHDGSLPATRIERAGYGKFFIVGENIAAGAMTAAEVMQGWLDSPAHCENIMDPRFAEIGIAFAVTLAGSQYVYWTQDFATPRRAMVPTAR